MCYRHIYKQPQPGDHFKDYPTKINIEIGNRLTRLCVVF
jgi:hypothetical protein